MRNKIYIVGTMHTQASNLIADGLYKFLCSVNPDVILFEFPLEVADQMEQWLNAAIEANSSLEAVVVKRYVEEYPVILEPYDIEGRNDYYMKNRVPFIEMEREAILESLLEKSEASIVTETLYEMNNKLEKTFWGNCENLSLNEINNAEWDRIVEHHRAIQISLERALLGLTPELQPFLESFDQWEDFENKREQAMVQNILTYNKRYHDSEIVVICGFSHRFKLIELLRKAESEEFTLITNLDDNNN